jgi:hypothetical protein
MIAIQPIGLTNTGLPLVVLVVGASVLPWAMTPYDTLSQRRLAVSVVGAAMALVLVGAGIFAALYALQGAAVRGALVVDAQSVLWFFFRLSLKAALFWVPVLALAWFVLAQGVERRRGEAVAKAGRR